MPDLTDPVSHTTHAPSPRQATILGASSGRIDAYDLITQRVVGLIEQGTIPWQKSWNVKLQWPRNLVTRRPYRGINVFLLLSMCYESPLWLTFRQASELGGHVKKGEKACPVVFWKKVSIEDKQTEEKRLIPFLRVYYVFNQSQCEGLKNVPPLSDELGTIRKPVEIVEAMPNRPVIKQGMTKAFYSPSQDYVGIPYPSKFMKEEQYHSVLFHELLHSTGHESRLNRASLSESAGFGTDPYCREELVAEMGAAFLCAQAGIETQTVENSAAYLRSWLGRLKGDRRLLVQAGAQAQAATDFILGITHEPTTTPEVPSTQPA
jgi:antirestriction protein ArdC